MRNQVLLLALVLALPAAPLPGQETGSPAAAPDSSSRSGDTILAPGARIRMRGDAVDHLGRPTGRDYLIFGLAGAHLFRGDAEGTVLFADADSLVFADRKREGVISLEWDRFESVELHRGRSVGRGTLEGAAWGAFGGLVMWGAMELAFSGSFFDVNGGVIMATSTAGGAVTGALSLGDRWVTVRPPRR